jgi:hypothetical protein
MDVHRLVTLHMFVRFRERKSDGRKPEIVQAQIACAGRCHKGPRRRPSPGFRTITGCHEQPRCRWSISLGSDLEVGLVPYRLLVSLIENRRVDDKVQQEHVADLGAIDGHMLAAFYAGIEPALAAAVQGEHWTRESVRARYAFWEGVNATLSRLSNRIDSALESKIRAAINERVPMLTTDELAVLPEWETEEQLQRWQQLKDGWAHLVTREKRDIAHYEKMINSSREQIARLQPAVDEVSELAKHVEEVGPDGFEATYSEANLALGEILAAGVRPLSREEIAKIKR